MVRYWCFYFLFCSCTSLLWGQSTFIKRMDLPGINALASEVVETDTNTFAVTGFYVDQANYGCHLSEFPADGPPRVLSIQNPPRGGGSGNLCVMLDSGFTVAGFSIDTTAGSSTSYGQLYRMDKEGNLLWERFYPLFRNTHFRGIAVMSDGSIVAGGYYQDTLDMNFTANWWVIRVDTAGDLIWQRAWATNDHDRIYFLTTDSGDNIHLFGGLGRNSLSGGISQHYKRLDKNGATLFEFSYSDYYNNAIFGKSALDNDGNIYTNRTSLMLKFTPQGERVWGTSFEFVDAVVMGRDSSLFTYGDVSGTFSSFFVAKFTRNGELVFRKEIDVGEDINLHDMIATKDGGFVICGEIGNTYPQELVLIKLNCEGEFVSDAEACDVQEPPVVVTPPKPDPATQNYVLGDDMLSGDFLGAEVGEAVEFEVYDLAGRELGSYQGPAIPEAGVRLGPVARGWYLYRFRSAGGLQKAGRIWKLAGD